MEEKIHYYIIHEAQGSGWFMNVVRVSNNLKISMGPTFVSVNTSFRSFLLTTPVIILKKKQQKTERKHEQEMIFFQFSMRNINIQEVKLKTFHQSLTLRDWKGCIQIFSVLTVTCTVGDTFPCTSRLFLGFRVKDRRWVVKSRKACSSILKTGYNAVKYWKYVVSMPGH